jgi:hypothetical protein
MHNDASGPSVSSGLWTGRRSKPRGKEASAGSLGTIAQCLSGDIVACESLDRKHVTYLSIAWQFRDGKAAMVRFYDPAEGCISCTAENMGIVLSHQRIRWLGVRPK